MKVSRLIAVLVLVVVSVWMIADPDATWIAGLSDSAWWAAVPWILLALLWVFLIGGYLKSRKGAQ